jgi:hypothetical protein
MRTFAVRLAVAVLLSTAALPIAITRAETIVVPIASDADREKAGPLPRLGMIRAKVREGWGDPLREHAAVGDPPIQRWEYPHFDVYFEYDHVVHAVAHHNPPPPVVTVEEAEE